MKLPKRNTKRLRLRIYKATIKYIKNRTNITQGLCYDIPVAINIMFKLNSKYCSNINGIDLHGFF